MWRFYQISVHIVHFENRNDLFVNQEERLTMQEDVLSTLQNINGGVSLGICSERRRRNAVEPCPGPNRVETLHFEPPISGHISTFSGSDGVRVREV